MFRVSGMLRGSVRGAYRMVTWDNGRVIGDADAVEMVVADARLREGEAVGPIEGPTTGRRHLRSPLSALIIMSSLFDPDTLVLSGDVPERPPIPEGAIG